MKIVINSIYYVYKKNENIFNIHICLFTELARRSKWLSQSVVKRSQR